MYEKIQDEALLLFASFLGGLKSEKLYSIVYTDEYTLTNLGIQLTSFFIKRCGYGVTYILMDDDIEKCDFNRNHMYFEYLENEYDDRNRLPRLENYIKDEDIDEIYNLQLEITNNNLIIVDGFHNIGISKKISVSKYEYITKRLKALAVEKRIPILILHKTNNSKFDLKNESLYKQYYSGVVDLRDPLNQMLYLSRI